MAANLEKFTNDASKVGNSDTKTNKDNNKDKDVGKNMTGLQMTEGLKQFLEEHQFKTIHDKVSGKTALHVAAITGKANLIFEIISNFTLADLMHKDNEGNSPRFYAEAANHQEVIKRLDAVFGTPGQVNMKDERLEDDDGEEETEESRIAMAMQIIVHKFKGDQLRAQEENREDKEIAEEFGIAVDKIAQKFDEDQLKIESENKQRFDRLAILTADYLEQTRKMLTQFKEPFVTLTKSSEQAPNQVVEFIQNFGWNWFPGFCNTIGAKIKTDLKFYEDKPEFRLLKPFIFFVSARKFRDELRQKEENLSKFLTEQGPLYKELLHSPSIYCINTLKTFLKKLEMLFIPYLEILKQDLKDNFVDKKGKTEHFEITAERVETYSKKLQERHQLFSEGLKVKLFQMAEQIKNLSSRKFVLETITEQMDKVNKNFSLALMKADRSNLNWCVATLSLNYYQTIEISKETNACCELLVKLYDARRENSSQENDLALQAQVNHIFSKTKSSLSFSEQDEIDRKKQWELEQQKRQKTAILRDFEAKRSLEEQKAKEEVKQKSEKDQKIKSAILKSIEDLKNERELFNQILSRDMHQKVGTLKFCKLIGQIAYFSFSETDLGNTLKFEDTVITSFHREHNGKKLDGDVFRKFKKVLQDMGVYEELIAKKPEASIKKRNATN